MNKITIPIAIMVSALILGLSFFGVQWNKARSIENQQERAYLDEQSKLIAEETKTRRTELMVGTCLNKADNDYWAYMRLNGTENAEGVVTAEMRFWDIAKENKQDDEDACYKKYR